MSEQELPPHPLDVNMVRITVTLDPGPEGLPVQYGCNRLFEPHHPQTDAEIIDRAIAAATTEVRNAITAAYAHHRPRWRGAL